MADQDILRELADGLPAMDETLPHMARGRRPDPLLIVVPILSDRGPWLPKNTAEKLGVEQKIRCDLAFKLVEGSPMEVGKRVVDWEHRNGVLLRNWDGSGQIGLGFPVNADFIPFPSAQQQQGQEVMGTIRQRGGFNDWDKTVRPWVPKLGRRMQGLIRYANSPIAMPESEAYYLASFLDLEAGPETDDTKVVGDGLPIGAAGSPANPWDTE